MILWYQKTILHTTQQFVYYIIAVNAIVSDFELANVEHLACSQNECTSFDIHGRSTHTSSRNSTCYLVVFSKARNTLVNWYINNINVLLRTKCYSYDFPNFWNLNISKYQKIMHFVWISKFAIRNYQDILFHIRSSKLKYFKYSNNHRSICNNSSTCARFLRRSL